MFNAHVLALCGTRAGAARPRPMPTSALVDPLAPTPIPSSRPAPPPPTARPTSDEAPLVARLVAGDADALAVLYDRHGRAAFTLARAMVGSASDAEDVVAAVFAQLWQSAHRFDAARGSVAAWITTMTRSRALDLLRAQRRRTRLHERAATADADGFAVPLGGGGDTPDVDAERAELAQAVRASLTSLPPAQRRAIELAFFGGLSHTDIAAALNEPLGTVKTRIRTGMLKLRDALRPMLPRGSA